MRLILTGKTFDDIKKQMASFFETTPIFNVKAEPKSEPKELKPEPKSEPTSETPKKRGRPKAIPQPKAVDAMTDFDNDMSNEDMGDVNENTMAPSPEELPDLKSEIDIAKLRAGKVAPDPVEEVEPEVKHAIDKAQVIDYLKRVNDQKGLAIAKKLLSDFNCARVSDLPEAKYEGFVKVCKELLS